MKGRQGMLLVWCVVLSCHSGTTGALDLTLPEGAGTGAVGVAGKGVAGTGGTGTGVAGTGGIVGSAGSTSQAGAPLDAAAGAPSPTCACHAAEVCVGGACLDACTVDAECKSGSRPRCSPDIGACVECLTASDCAPDRPVCAESAVCVECSSDSDCLDPQTPRCVQAEGRCR